MYKNIILSLLIICLGACTPKEVDRTKLAEYAQNRQIKEIKYLIKQGALNSREHSTLISDALVVASHNGYVDILKLLHKVYSTFDISSKKTETEPSTTPLIAAINNNRLKTIEYLLNNGASIEYKGDTKMTPLAHAMSNWCYKTPADISKLQGNSFKQELEHFKNKQIQTIELLLKKGANPHTIDVLGRTPIAVVAFPCLAPDWTSTHKLLDLLLKYGAHINGDKGRIIPLNVATPEMTSVLLDKGADVNATDSLGITPLIQAVSTNQMNKLQILLKAGANVNHTDELFRTALSIAIENNDAEIVKVLLENGADSEQIFKENPRNMLPSKPLTLACIKRNAEIVKLLLKHKANADIIFGQENVWSKSPLETAAFYSTPEIVQLLIDNGASVNQQNWHEKGTPLMAAVTANNLENVKILLEHKVDPNLKDKFEHTALWYAQRKGNKEIIQLLRKYGAK